MKIDKKTSKSNKLAKTIAIEIILLNPKLSKYVTRGFRATDRKIERISINDI